MSRMTEAVISKLKRCRLIIRHGVGYDNVDVKACTKHGIQFAYQPDYCKEDVAEHAIALIFACARKGEFGSDGVRAEEGDGNVKRTFIIEREQGF